MTTTFNNSYLLKVSTEGEGVKIVQNSVHVVCTRPQHQKMLFTAKYTLYRDGPNDSIAP